MYRFIQDISSHKSNLKCCFRNLTKTKANVTGKIMMLIHASIIFFSTAMTNIHQRKSGTYGNKQLYLTISKNNEQMNLSCGDYRHW